MTITEHDNMLFFGVINGHKHHLFIGSCMFKQFKQSLTLIRINGSLFHGEASFILFVRLLADRR